MDLLALRVENRHLFRLVSAREDHDVCVAEQLALLLERVGAHKTCSRLHAFVDSHPQILGVATNARERVHDSALAQIELLIIALVQFLSCLLHSAEVHLDLLSVHDGHVVLAHQDGPRHRLRFLVVRLARTAL